MIQHHTAISNLHRIITVQPLVLTEQLSVYLPYIHSNVRAVNCRVATCLVLFQEGRRAFPALIITTLIIWGKQKHRSTHYSLYYVEVPASRTGHLIPCTYRMRDWVGLTSLPELSRRPSPPKKVHFSYLEQNHDSTVDHAVAYFATTSTELTWLTYFGNMYTWNWISLVSHCYALNVHFAFLLPSTSVCLHIDCHLCYTAIKRWL